MQPIRKVARLCRRMIGVNNGSSVPQQQAADQTQHPAAPANDQTLESTAHYDRKLEDLRVHFDEKTAELQARFLRQVAGLASPIARGGASAEAVGQLHALQALSDATQDDQLGLYQLPEWEALSKRGVFVVGNARSGTSILSTCLNESPDIYQLRESDLYIQYKNPDFRAWFNQRHDNFRSPPSKGTFVPEPPIPLKGGMAYMAWLARHYRYVGEKIAFGPLAGTLRGVPFQDAFFRFQSKYFFPATYFLIVRTPAECAWSMHKMFPTASAELLLECWLRSVNLCIDLYSAFPHCYMIFLEHLNSETIDRVSQVLQTDIPLPPKLLTDRAKASRLAPGEVPEILSGSRKPLQQCARIYDHMINLFSPHTLRYDGDGALARSLVNPLKAKLERTLDGVMPGATCLRYRIAG